MKKRISKKNLVAISLIGLQLGFTLLFFSKLPSTVSLLFDFESNSFLGLSRIFIFLVPLLSALYFLFYTNLPKLDVYIKNAFENVPLADCVGLSRIIFLSVLQFSIILNALKIPHLMIIPFITLAIITFYYGWVIMHSYRTFLFGLVTPWSIMSDEVWERTNMIGGDCLMGYSFLIFFSLFLIDYWLYTLVLPLIAIHLFLWIYSYRHYEEEHRKHHL